MKWCPNKRNSTCAPAVFYSLRTCFIISIVIINRFNFIVYCKKLLLLLSNLLSLSLCSFHFILFIIGFDCLQKEKWEKNRSFYSNKSVFSVRTFIRPNVFSAHASTTTTTITTMREEQGDELDNKWIKKIIKCFVVLLLLLSLLAYKW